MNIHRTIIANGNPNLYAVLPPNPAHPDENLVLVPVVAWMVCLDAENRMVEDDFPWAEPVCPNVGTSRLDYDGLDPVIYDKSTEQWIAQSFDDPVVGVGLDSLKAYFDGILKLFTDTSADIQADGEASA